MNINDSIFKKCYPSYFLPAIFLLISILLKLTLAQSNIKLSGKIFDASDGSSVSGAVIQIDGTTFVTSSEMDGSFTLENIPAGIYTVIVKSMGYKTFRMGNVIINEDNAPRIQPDLEPNPIRGDSILVVSEIFPEGAVKEVINAAEINRFKNLGLNRLLQQVAGIQVESISETANQSVIRIHGGKANQVLVLLDGQRLNNAQSGEVDLSIIPIDVIDKIEIIKQGQTALYGGSAYAGIIDFKTKKTDGSNYGLVRSQAGSFEHAMGNVGIGVFTAPFGIIGNYQQNYSRQNFDYLYNSEVLKRENAWTQNHNIFFKISSQVEANDINVLYTYRHNIQGLPSAFYEEMNHFAAYKEENFHNFQTNYLLLISSKAYLQTFFGYNRLFQIYDNTQDSSPFTRYKIQQLNKNFEFKSELFRTFETPFETRVGIQYLKEELNQDNLLFPEQSIGKKSRERYAAYGSVEWVLSFTQHLFEKSVIRSALRLEKYFNTSGALYPLLGLTFTPKYLNEISISTNWGKAVRYPDFNSLFWKGDAQAQGNPDLLPEKKTFWDFGFRFSPSSHYLPKLGFYFYSENIEDLIFWQRTTRGIWQPKNEANVKQIGWDLQFEQYLYGNYVDLKVAYSYLDAVNLSEEINRQDKRIIFIPEHSINSSLSLDLYPFNSLLIHRYVSEREITPANTGVPLDAYQIWDFLISYHYLTGRFHFVLDFTVKNIRETAYELLRGYPMPGRSYLLTVSLKYNEVN